MKIIVSSCLLGNNCKYNGKNNYNPKLIDFLKQMEIIEVCPEQMLPDGLICVAIILPFPSSGSCWRLPAGNMPYTNLLL